MLPISASSRILALILGALLGLAAFSPSASAFRGTGPVGGQVQFAGRVTAVEGLPADAAGLTLQLKDRTVLVRIDPRATITARSAEAEIEGFQVGDYAIVLARRVSRAWLAYRIYFDVRPFTLIHTVKMTGTIVKIRRNGLRLEIRTDAGSERWVTIVRRTRFRLDGQPVDAEPPLHRGDVVQVVLTHTARGWIAQELNVGTG